LVGATKKNVKIEVLQKKGGRKKGQFSSCGKHKKGGGNSETGGVIGGEAGWKKS